MLNILLLSRLENNVNSQFVPDANGLDRFKNGFFTDNFADRKGQDSATEGKIVLIEQIIF